MSKFQNEQEVFDEHGNAFTYIAYSHGEHVVREILEDHEDGSPYSGEVRVLRAVFPTAESGRQKMDAQLAALQEKISGAKLELNNIQGANHAAHKEISERADRLKQHDQLAFLDDYLKGKITHYVELPDYGYGCAVIPVTDVSDIERSERKFRLLTLSGSSDYYGHISWKLNRYSDGSGSDKTVYPCRSLDEAQTKARQVLESQIAELMAKPVGSRGGNNDKRFHECCAEHGVSVPQDLVDDVKAREVKAALSRREQLQQELSKLNNQIEAAQ